MLSPHSRSQRLREGGIALLSRYRAPFLSRPHRDLLFKQPSSWHCWWRSGLSMWRAPLLQHLSLWSCLGEDKGWVADEKSIGLACEACQTGLALYICALHKSWVTQGVRGLDLHEHFQQLQEDPKATSVIIATNWISLCNWHHSKLDC